MTTWMHKHRVMLCVGALGLLWLVLVTGVLMPAMQTCDALTAEIQQQTSHLALLQRTTKPAVRPQQVGPLFLGPDVLLRAARQAGMSAVSVDDTKTEGYQLSGEASVAAFALWLQLLAQAEVGVRFGKVDVSVQTDGRLHFTLTASQTGELAVEPDSHAWPLGNPFCHTASLNEALLQAAIPPIQRYPLSDIHWIGRAVLSRVPYALLALPGGATVSVRVGETVSEAQARVVSVGAQVLLLRLANGQTLTLKQERGE